MQSKKGTSKRSAALFVGGVAAVAGLAGYLIARKIVRDRRRFDFAGKTAVVTGGSSGLGLAIARELAHRGAKVAICARGEAELRDAQHELEAQEAQVLAVVCDVTDAAAVGQFLQQTRDQLGEIDVLINNAGTIIVGPEEHMHLKDYRQVMDTNFFGPLHALLNVLPDMRRRKSGRVVNIASIGGKMPTPHMSPYAASKFALVGLGQTLRAELLPYGVYVTTVSPGLIRTGSTPNAKFKGDHEAERAWFETSDNLPIVSIDPERLAKQILHAAEFGDAELVSPFPERIVARLHGLMPGVSTDVLGLIGAFLPKAGGAGSDTAVAGADVSDSAVDPITRSREQDAERRFQ